MPDAIQAQPHRAGRWLVMKAAAVRHRSGVARWDRFFVPVLARGGGLGHGLFFFFNLLATWATAGDLGRLGVETGGPMPASLMRAL